MTLFAMDGDDVHTVWSMLAGSPSSSGLNSIYSLTGAEAIIIIFLTSPVTLSPLLAVEAKSLLFVCVVGLSDIERQVNAAEEEKASSEV